MKPNKNSFLNQIRQLLHKTVSFFAMILDKLLYSNRYAGLVSLAIALLLFVSVSYSNQQANSITSSYTFENVPIETVIDATKFDVSGIPEKITAVVTGDYVSVNAMKSGGKVSVVLDLENLTEGVHRVKLGVKGVTPALDVMISPEVAEISIQKKASQTFKITPEFINIEKVDPQYIVSSPILDVNEVTINASSEKLKNVSMVKALIDVKDKKESFEAPANVAIYDQEGKRMDVVVSPATVQAKVTISSPSRQVPIVVKPMGQLPNNKAIDKVTLDYNSVVLYAQQDVLNKISSIQAPINAESLIQSGKLKVTLDVPEGVRLMNTQVVNLDITLGDKTSKTIEKSQIFFENNTKNFEVKKSDGSDLVSDVVIEGTKRQLDLVDVSKIRVSLDMSKSVVGKQKVKLTVSGPNEFINYRLLNEEIEIIVSEKEN